MAQDESLRAEAQNRSVVSALIEPLRCKWVYKRGASCLTLCLPESAVVNKRVLCSLGEFVVSFGDQSHLLFGDFGEEKKVAVVRIVNQANCPWRYWQGPNFEEVLEKPGEKNYLAVSYGQRCESLYYFVECWHQSQKRVPINNKFWRGASSSEAESTAGSLCSLAKCHNTMVDSPNIKRCYGHQCQYAWCWFSRLICILAYHSNLSWILYDVACLSASPHPPPQKRKKLKVGSRDTYTYWG